MNQIICVYVGSKYTWDYVEKLYSGCNRNMDSPFEFTVLTDREDVTNVGTRTLKVEPIAGVSSQRLWWYKMQAFRPDVVEDNNLLLDIDVVITNNLDRFFNYKPGQFKICQDFNRHWNRTYGYSNSSVVGYNKSQAQEIWATWSAGPDTHMRRYRGDQDMLDAVVPNKIWWPYEWVKSWKWEVDRGGMITPNGDRYNSIRTVLDPECSIIAFHGKPDPHEISDTSIRGVWVF